MNAVDVDVTTLKDRASYYKARKIYLENLLLGHLSKKQRREAEFELRSVSVKAMRLNG